MSNTASLIWSACDLHITIPIDDAGLLLVPGYVSRHGTLEARVIWVYSSIWKHIQLGPLEHQWGGAVEEAAHGIRE